MERNITHLITDFRILSSRITEGIFNDFSKNVKSLNRKMDENVFQQLQAMYIDELEKQLQKAAKEMIEANKGNREARKLQHNLASRISYIVSEFLMKMKSM